GAERAARSNGAPNGSHSAARIDGDDVHPRAYRGAVRRTPLELERDPPVLRPSRILEQHASEPVALVRASEHHVHVFVAIAIEIGKGGRVPLLNVAEPAGQRDLFEAP